MNHGIARRMRRLGHSSVCRQFYNKTVSNLLQSQKIIMCYRAADASGTRTEFLLSRLPALPFVIITVYDVCTHSSDCKYRYKYINM